MSESQKNVSKNEEREIERVRHRSIKIIILQQIKIDPGGWTRSIASSIVLYIYIVAIADISLRKKTHENNTQ